jgi:ribosomal protein L7Ae-like RNA K-turn-binding protein
MIRPTKRQRVECPPSWLDCATLQAVPAAASRSTTTHVAPNNVSGMIRTPMASSTTKDIFLDRLRKEVVDKYKFSVASPKATTSAAGTGGGTAVGSMKDMSDGNDKADDPVHSQQRIRALLRRRIAIGLNECTRALESAVGRQRRTRGETLTNRGCQEPANTTMNQTDEALDVEFDGGPLLVVVAAEGMRPSPLPVVHIPVLASELNLPLLLLPESSTRRDLGRILGIKSASVLAFLPRPPSPQSRSTHSLSQHKPIGGATREDGLSDDPNDDDDDDADDDDIRQANAGLDSFIQFVCGKAKAAAPPASAAR